MVEKKSVSFVVPCKGRLHHLKETLPLMAKQSPDEIVVVDYNCPDGTAKWVSENFPRVNVVHVTDNADWNLSKARNLGARASLSTWICFIDADIKIVGDLASLWEEFIPEHFYRAAMNEKKHEELFGTVICSRGAYDKVQGYDEVFKGWGGEDKDFYERLKLQGYLERFFEPNYLEAIHNDHNERFRFDPHPEQTRNIKLIKTRLYTAVKRQIMFFGDAKGDVPLRMREKLYSEIDASVERWRKESTESVSIRFSFDSSEWLPKPYKMMKHCTIELAVKPR